MGNIKLIILFIISTSFGRKHNIDVSNDVRKYIPLSTFGFYKRGFLEVKLINFIAQPIQKGDLFGFSLDRTQNNIINSYVDTHQETCLLKQNFPNEEDIAVIYFILDFYNNKMVVNCSTGWEQPLRIHNSSDIYKLDVVGETAPFVCTHSLPLFSKTINNVIYYNTSFVIHIASNCEEGLYNLYFHNCQGYTHKDEVSYNFTMEIVEKNPGSYLSAGETPLPALYCIMGVSLLLSGCIWLYLLNNSTHPISKIHYLMTVLVFVKSIALTLNGINYLSIELKGVHVGIWVILFYIAHLLKGVLFNITIFLVGIGWTFIKYALVFKDKVLLIVVIVLQVVANIASIMLEDSEEAAGQYKMWQKVFILADLMGCILILVPIVWSIRYLRKASTANNVRKLKLFKHFFIMVICYTYFTRILVYLLRLTVPFQYGWFQELSLEVATYIFYTLTAYKFRPAVYDLLTENDAVQGLTRVNPRIENQHGVFITEVTEEEGDALLSKKEYDFTI